MEEKSENGLVTNHSLTELLLRDGLLSRQRNIAITPSEDTYIEVASHDISKTFIYGSFRLSYIVFHGHIHMTKTANRLINPLSTIT